MSVGRESGLSLVGFMLVLVLISFGVYVLVRLVPIYIDNWQINESLKSVAQRRDAPSMDGQQLRTALKREFSVGYVSRTNVDQDLTINSTANGGRLLNYDYTVRAPLIGNVTLLVHFDDQQQVPAS